MDYDKDWTTMMEMVGPRFMTAAKELREAGLTVLVDVSAMTPYLAIAGPNPHPSMNLKALPMIQLEADPVGGTVTFHCRNFRGFGSEMEPAAVTPEYVDQLIEQLIATK